MATAAAVASDRKSPMFCLFFRFTFLLFFFSVGLSILFVWKEELTQETFAIEWQTMWSDGMQVSRALCSQPTTTANGDANGRKTKSTSTIWGNR